MLPVPDCEGSKSPLELTPGPKIVGVPLHDAVKTLIVSDSQ
jgi:hypothetical protein